MRRIFITGASSGIGQALAIKLAQEGHILGLAARRQDKLEQVAQQVQAAGGKAYLYPLDVRDRRQQFEAINHFAGLGGLDAAVANAGFGITKPILATSEEEARELFDVNLFGLLYTLQASAPHLHDGVFVGVSSVVAYALPTGYGVYSASKSAVSSLLTVARREMGNQFKVVLVSPGGNSDRILASCPKAFWVFNRWSFSSADGFGRYGGGSNCPSDRVSPTECFYELDRAFIAHPTGCFSGGSGTSLSSS